MARNEPRWLVEARKYIGLTEVPGSKHNNVILGWLAQLKAWWRDDETPWCGTFVAHCMREAGFELPQHWMRAKAWATWGANLRSTRVAPGAILVFSRDGGGHVGFYVGEDASFYSVLGGNQRNEVNIMRISKVRCIAIRWPRNEPVIGSPVRLTGNAVSDNEA